jgi:hypothetical protein
MLSIGSISALGAVGAGLASFLSPYVFPLVPGYLSYLAGATGSGEAGPCRWAVMSSLTTEFAQRNLDWTATTQDGQRYPQGLNLQAKVATRARPTAASGWPRSQTATATPRP